MKFPGSFEFYHLGQIELLYDWPSERTFDDQDAIVIKYYGDKSGIFLLTFPQGQDSSIYSELANTIAAQTLLSMTSKEESDLMISTPHFINQIKLKNSFSPLFKYIENKKTHSKAYKIKKMGTFFFYCLENEKTSQPLLGQTNESPSVFFSEEINA